jgi:hypothetical protein
LLVPLERPPSLPHLMPSSCGTLRALQRGLGIAENVRFNWGYSFSPHCLWRSQEIGDRLSSELRRRQNDYCFGPRSGPTRRPETMSRSKQTSMVKRPRKAVTAALGVAGALSLASGASALTASTGEIRTPETASVFLAEEEMSDVSLATFYLFDKENAGVRTVRVAAHGGCGHGGCGGRGCGGRGCGGCRGCGHGGCRGCGGGCGGCGGCGCCFWIGPVRVC